MTPGIELDCAAVDELTAAYALGAVDPAEDRAISEHLATCNEPHDDARAVLDGAATVAASLEPVSPSAGLRDRLMASVASTPQDHRAPAARADQPLPIEEPRRPWWRVADLPCPQGDAAQNEGPSWEGPSPQSGRRLTARTWSRA